MTLPLVDQILGGLDALPGTPLIEGVEDQFQDVLKLTEEDVRAFGGVVAWMSRHDQDPTVFTTKHHRQDRGHQVLSHTLVPMPTDSMHCEQPPRCSSRLGVRVAPPPGADPVPSKQPVGPEQ